MCNQFIQKWQSWVPQIGRDLLDMHLNRRLFSEVTSLFQHNDATLVEGSIWRWMAGNYAWSIAMGIRRQTDLDSDVISMAQLIDDIATHSDALERAWFVEHCVASAPDRFTQGAAHAIFDQYAPGGASHVSPDRIRRDQEYLQEDAQRVRQAVNRRFAHNSIREAPNDVTLGELHHALHMVSERYRVYARLLVQNTISLETPLPGDWSRPFVMQLRTL
jgi:hypothetical protein